MVKNAVCLSTIDSDSGYGDGFRFKKSDQKEGVAFLDDTVPGMIYGVLHPRAQLFTGRNVGGIWGIHRAELQEVLLRRLNKDMHLNLSSRVVACEEQGNIASIKFEDGTTANFDLVIGADGLKSVIRRDLLTAKFPDEIDRILPIWSGSTVYRFLVPMQALSQKAADHPAITKATMVSSTAGSITTEY